MSSIPLRNIFFPAVLMSSAVFSALTLPLVLVEPASHSQAIDAQATQNVVATDSSSLLAQGFQPILDIFESGNKGLAIRYIGFSIVASVGAGIATAEVMRKASRRLEVLNERLSAVNVGETAPLPLSDLSAPDLSVQPSATDWPEAWFETAEHTRSFLSKVQQMPMDSSRSEYVGLAERELVYAGWVSSDTDSEVETVVDYVSINTTADDPKVIPLPDEGSIDPESTFATLLTDPASYQTCRISVPHSRKRLFALLYQGEYYRLVRARKTWEKALELAARLKQLSNEVLITQNDANYTVWILEPQAFPYSAYPG